MLHTELYTNNLQPQNGHIASSRYQIIEQDDSLMISESRVGVFDVMELFDQGLSIYEIAATFNLSPLQVQTAIDYIEKNRIGLTPRFVNAIKLREERERYYRAEAEELDKKLATLPMTPRRAEFLALKDKNRRLDEKESYAVRTQ